MKHESVRGRREMIAVRPAIIWEELSGRQRQLLKTFEGLLLEANARLNLISRATATELHRRHVLHSLALAARPFQDGSAVVDWGTGAGLPAIPLAIVYPTVSFHAVDVSERKTLAVRLMARRLGLQNLTTWTGRAELWPGRAHYSVSRAVASLRELWHWHARVAISSGTGRCPGAWWPGAVCLKGGDLGDEIADMNGEHPSVRVDTAVLAGEGFMSAKFIVHMREPA